MGYSSAGEVRGKYGEKVTAVCKERSAEMVQPASRGSVLREKALTKTRLLLQKYSLTALYFHMLLSERVEWLETNAQP